MIFPVYRRAGGVVFLDDDPAYLEMLAEVMPEHWPVRLFTRPSECINYLQQEPPELDADSWRHREIIDRWHSGQSLIAQILRYWREADPWRYGLAQVCVVDYSMPAMNGLQVLEELAGWPGARVLLTGRADEQIAVQAFNAALIEQYVPKQASEISRRLTHSIQRLLDEPWGSQAQAWRASLSREQLAVITAPSIARQLKAFAETLRWVEHVVIGDPFGVLGLDDTGQATWLQIEHERRLDDLAEVAACGGLSGSDLEDIRAGRSLFDGEFQLAIGSDRPGLVVARPLGQGVLAALTQVPDSLNPGPDQGYACFVRDRGARLIDDATPLRGGMVHA
jgi:CheY-like chemotaxis protein